MIDDPYTAGADGIDVERRNYVNNDDGTHARDSGNEPPESEGSLSAASRDRDDDPPPEADGDTGDGDPNCDDDRDCDCDDDHDCDDDRDSDCDSEPIEYRLERLRLWRAIVTLAAVLARLIRSL